MLNRIPPCGRFKTFRKEINYQKEIFVKLFIPGTIQVYFTAQIR